MKASLFSQRHITTVVAMLLTMVPLIRLTYSLDAHMVGGWLILSCVLFVSLASGILSLHKHTAWITTVMVLLAIVQAVCGCLLNLEDLVLLFMAILLLGVRVEVPLEPIKIYFRRGIYMGLGIQILLLLYLLINASISRGYNHETTYAVQPLFAHRNIAIESCMIWLYWLLNQCDNKKQARVIILLSGLLAFVFQARSAMLMWVIMLMVKHKSIFTRNHLYTRIGAIGLALFCSLQLFIALMPADVYKPIFDKLPDNLKAIDISYNLDEARSSSDRLELWLWTYENLNVWGHGLGQWRTDAQGEVNERIGRCDLFVRHAHSDLMEYLYELGVLPVSILLFILLFLARNQWSVIFVFMPLLLFSFPTERPEIMAALAFSMMLGTGFSSVEELKAKKFSKSLGIVFSAMILVGISSWTYSQHLFGKFFLKKTDISKLNTSQQIIIALYPQDLLNNSLALYQAHYLISHQNSEAAIHILQERLRVNPKDLGVQKQLLEIDTTARDMVVYCTQNIKP